MISIYSAKRFIDKHLEKYRYEIEYLEKIPNSGLLPGDLKKYYEINNKQFTETPELEELLQEKYKTAEINKAIYDLANKNKTYKLNKNYFKARDGAKKNNIDIKTLKISPTIPNFHPLSFINPLSPMKLIRKYVEHYETKDNIKDIIQSAYKFLDKIGDIDLFQNFRESTLSKYIARILYILAENDYYNTAKEDLTDDFFNAFTDKRVSFKLYDYPIIEGSLRDPLNILLELESISEENLLPPLELWTTPRDYKLVLQ